MKKILIELVYITENAHIDILKRRKWHAEDIK